MPDQKISWQKALPNGLTAKNLYSQTPTYILQICLPVSLYSHSTYRWNYTTNYFHKLSELISVFSDDTTGFSGTILGFFFCPEIRSEAGHTKSCKLFVNTPVSCNWRISAKCSYISMDFSKEKLLNFSKETDWKFIVCLKK